MRSFLPTFLENWLILVYKLGSQYFLENFFKPVRKAVEVEHDILHTKKFDFPFKYLTRRALKKTDSI